MPYALQVPFVTGQVFHTHDLSNLIRTAIVHRILAHFVLLSDFF
jgi:hypothetical protein